MQSGTNTKTFDSLNRILTDNQNGHVVSYEYLDSQNKIKITDEKGNVKQEEYDNVGRLKKVIAGEEITEYVYNANGSLQKKIAQNNITEYEYYPDKEIKNLTIKDSSDNIIESHNYEYDNNNNKTKDDNDIYEYDVLDRIKKVNGVEKYTYDDANNITSKIQADGTVIAYTYNAKNQLTRTVSQKNLEILSETTYTCDANGNQITSTTGEEVLTNIYNEKNELEKVKKNGNEIASYRYDGTRVILELGNENEEKAVNTYGLELVSRKQNENNYYYLYNRHGDVTGLVDANNTKVNTYKYDEYGNVTEETEGVENPYRYAGYYYDKETENYYLQSRYYNPAIQRFISEDTVRGDIEDPLSLNLYTYTHNNPLKYIDPNGHIQIETIFDIASLLISGKDFIVNPSLKTFGALAWDTAAALLPYMPGSYITKGAKVLNKADDITDLYRTVKIADKVDDATDLYKAVSVADRIDDAADLYKTARVVDKVDDVTDLYKTVKVADRIDDVADTYKVAKTADKTSDFVKNTKRYKQVTNSNDLTKAANIKRYQARNVKAEEGFTTYYNLKKSIGKAGDGKQWHHIVEQSQIRKSGIDAKLIHNPNNVISLTQQQHRKISSIYSSQIPGTKVTVREYLKGKTFKEQYKYGIKMLKEIGVL